jgi:predicted nucleic acid-binding protein
MTDRAFLDSNIVVYLFDWRASEKQRTAGLLMQRLVREQVLPVVSTQVLQEAYSALTRKLHMDPTDTLTELKRMEEASFSVTTVDTPLIWRAAGRSIQDKISFWDGLIVESALAAQCSRLYSEDLQAGRVFSGLEVVNPFQ